MTTLAERLVAQAEGSHPAEAAAALLIEAASGWLLEQVRHAINDYPDVGRAAPDWDAIGELRWGASGGERRLLSLAMALGSSEHEVNLQDALTGLDEVNARLVSTAVAHAAGCEVGLLDRWRR